MILGVLIGTYSSIFVASPILKFLKLAIKLWKKKRKNSSLINKGFVQQPLIVTLAKTTKYLI